MTVREAIARAEALLPGHASPEEEEDPRWQAIIAVGNFIQTNPDEVWPFTLRWGCSDDADLRSAIATCVLEHLLEHHFDSYITGVEEAVRSRPLFADTFSRCWKLGQAEEAGRAARFDRLMGSAKHRDR